MKVIVDLSIWSLFQRRDAPRNSQPLKELQD